jgi:polyisoprenyl-teichoic acid--peptidoglycan teichoic acid transferase
VTDVYEPASRSRRDSLAGLRRLGKELRRPQPAASVDQPAASPRRGGAHRRYRNLRRWPRRTLIAVNIVTVLALLGAGGAYGYVQWRLGQIKRISVFGLHIEGKSSQSATTSSSAPPFTMLVIGSDTRNLGAGSSAAFGSDTSVGGQRSDSIILVRVVPKTRSLALMSIPRDTLVSIPGYGTTRINTAFNAGTASLLVTVLDQDFGIEVNHVAIFNFDTFRALADAVGGVDQYFPTPARDINASLNIPQAGCVNLSGDQALAFVRSREYEYYLNGEWHYQLYPESDLARIQRQQAFFKALARKAKKVAPTNPLALNGIIAGITKNLTLDSSFSNSELLSLAQNFRSANLSTIPSYTYPTVNSTAVPGALDPQTQQGQAVIQQWLSVGQPAPTASNPSSSPAAKPVITVNPSSVSIQIENGSGVGGQAAQAGQDLASLGYKTTVSGDAPNFGLSTTEIEYAPDSLAAAKQVQSQLVGGATLAEDSALTPTPYNLLVTTGSNYTGVVGSTHPASNSTTSSTTTAVSPAYGGTQTVTPDSSSVYDGVYIPPGLEPGQIPQTCGE